MACLGEARAEPKFAHGAVHYGDTVMADTDDPYVAILVLRVASHSGGPVAVHHVAVQI
jgi:hypothetical protein